MTHTTRSLTFIALVAAAALGTAARAEPRDPAALMDTGLAAYQAGDYDAAIAAFRAAYAADERPAALFAMAQAERKRGDCAAAVSDYDRFLATSPAERQAGAARDQRKVCSDQLAAAPKTEAQPETRRAPVPSLPPVAAAPSAPIAAPPARSQTTRAWYRDPLADALVGGATLGVALGAGFTAESSHLAHEANEAMTYSLHTARATSSAHDHDVAIGAFAGGAVMAGVAAWRIISSRSHRHAPADHLALAPGPGLGLALVGGF